MSIRSIRLFWLHCERFPQTFSLNNHPRWTGEFGALMYHESTIPASAYYFRKSVSSPPHRFLNHLLITAFCSIREVRRNFSSEYPKVQIVGRGLRWGSRFFWGGFCVFVFFFMGFLMLLHWLINCLVLSCSAPSKKKPWSQWDSPCLNKG